MRVRTFKPQFAPLVKSGIKRQTIRPLPKRLPKAGDHESWRQWTGRPYNSPQLELAQVELTSVRPITISSDGVTVDGQKMSYAQETVLAQLDGFKDCVSFMLWFQKEHGLPFNGIMIKAKDLKC